jgi:hypothetical protein
MPCSPTSVVSRHQAPCNAANFAFRLSLERRPPPTNSDFEALSHGLPTRCLRFAPCIAAPGRKTRFRLEATLGRAGLSTSRVPLRGFRFLDLSPLPGFAWRTSSQECTKPPSDATDLDLEAYSEATRRALYDIVVAVHFTAPADAAPGDCFPDYTPDQAGLVIDFSRGRWLAGWCRLEETDSDLPESRRQALVRIQAHPGAPCGVAFYEV